MWELVQDDAAMTLRGTVLLVIVLAPVLAPARRVQARSPLGELER